MVVEIKKEDSKLIEVQKKIEDLRERNGWCEIVLLFKDGALVHWSDKNEHQV